MRDRLLKIVPVMLVLVAVSVWAFWPTMRDLFKEWQRNEDYSAGQLVPLVAL